VADLRVARKCGDALGPFLDLRTVNFHRSAAQPADEVVMVVAAHCSGVVSAAEAILRLPVRSVYDVDLAGIDERLQVPVDRGQPDGLPATAELSMEVLRRTKSGRLTQHSVDGLTLTSDPHPATAERSLRLHRSIVLQATRCPSALIAAELAAGAKVTQSLAGWVAPGDSTRDGWRRFGAM
jgi:hypothetical protein